MTIFFTGLFEFVERPGLPGRDKIGIESKGSFPGSRHGAYHSLDHTSI